MSIIDSSGGVDRSRDCRPASIPPHALFDRLYTHRRSSQNRKSVLFTFGFDFPTATPV
jgi:hypothetical protein